MLYLTLDTSGHRLAIPHGGRDVDTDALQLAAVSTGTLTPVTFDIDAATTAGDFVILDVETPDALTPGEWRYDLAQGAELISAGLLIVREGESAGNAEYERKIEYKAYERND